MAYPIETIDPDSPVGPPFIAILPDDLIAQYRKEEPLKYENLRCVKSVLESPLRIYGGVRNLNKGGTCYVGIPETWYVADNVTAPFPQHYVFAVYVNPGKFIYEARAELRDEDGSTNVKHWQERFSKGLIWATTS